MAEKEAFLKNLSKSELKVHDYIKEKSAQSDGRFQQSMSKIGDALGISEATVHRAVRRLKKDGIIGIIPSQEKAESNHIVYYGVPDEEEQVNTIISMASDLSSSINRFQTLMEVKDQTIRTMEKERDRLIKQVEEQQTELENYKQVAEKMTQIVASYEKGMPVFSDSKIIGYTELDDGSSALIFKEK
ncbi:Lrp/AsnC family transcriptional regulator [Virgibacillus salexigens]|uniref:Uncharacterized protein n=1 Tax=Virgibacillus massiliensis TaxID=1462526 RepID=A0A024QH72_9BACI|nr:Lrp/AsnC family transcriptional regulator [Virgibacillus massiliensis]CDQ41903.1 hypothetical protein BN990_04282 [Virgibacillus massiliensis]